MAEVVITELTVQLYCGQDDVAQYDDGAYLCLVVALFLVVGIYHPLTQVPPDCLRKRTPPMCPRVRLRAFAGVCGP